MPDLFHKIEQNLSSPPQCFFRLITHNHLKLRKILCDLCILWYCFFGCIIPDRLIWLIVFCVTDVNLRKSFIMSCTFLSVLSTVLNEHV